MKYVHIFGGNGYCGCDFEEYMEVDDETTEAEIADMAYELAMQNAESFSHVHFGWDEVPPDDTEEYAEYLEGVDYNYEFCSKEEFEENW